MNTIKFKKLEPEAKLPLQMTPGAVGHDVYACLISQSGRQNHLIIPPRTTRTVPTGLQIEPPPGHFVMVCTRSGLAKQHSLFVANSPGIIDPDYRGELMVLLHNGGHESFYIHHAMRIAQLILAPAIPTECAEVEELSPTVRGAKGLGSTGL